MMRVSIGRRCLRNARGQTFQNRPGVSGRAKSLRMCRDNGDNSCRSSSVTLPISRPKESRNYSGSWGGARNCCYTTFFPEWYMRERMCRLSGDVAIQYDGVMYLKMVWLTMIYKLSPMVKFFDKLFKKRRDNPCYMGKGFGLGPQCNNIL